jgi:Flp pilus assembly protein CpaB
MNYTARNLIIAMALALVGIVLTSSYIGSQKQKLVKGKEHVTVLVAKKDIPAGTKVSELKGGGYLDEKSVLRDDQAPGALANLKGMSKLSTNGSIFAGQQITSNEIDTVDKLDPGATMRGTERQVAVALGQGEGGANFIKAGDRIDLFASDKVSYPKQHQDDISTTWVVARNVLVVKTPKDLLPPDADQEPAKANGDEQLFVVKVSDKVAQNIIWSLSFSDDHHLYATLRPRVNVQETKLKPQTDLPPVS